MPSEDQWIQAICDVPEEDGPRLDYADWLTEQGNPRGEFIRLQCELAGLQEGDDRCSGIAERIEVLLDAHQRSWLGPLADRLSNWSFSRGCLASASVYGRGSWQGPSLNGTQLADLLPLLPPTINELVLSGNQLGAAGAQALVGADHLRLLNTLDVSGYQPECKFTDYEPFEANVGSTGAGILAQSEWSSRLRVLDLSLNQIDDEAALTLAASPHLQNLEQLTIHETHDSVPMTGPAWFEPATVAALQATFGSRLTMRQGTPWTSEADRRVWKQLSSGQ